MWKLPKRKYSFLIIDLKTVPWISLPQTNFISIKFMVFEKAVLYHTSEPLVGLLTVAMRFEGREYTESRAYMDCSNFVQQLLLGKMLLYADQGQQPYITILGYKHTHYPLKKKKILSYLWNLQHLLSPHNSVQMTSFFWYIFYYFVLSVPPA